MEEKDIREKSQREKKRRDLWFGGVLGHLGEEWISKSRYATRVLSAARRV